MAVTDDTWPEFFAATADRGPRDHLLRLLEHAPHAGAALDFGCGCGHDTVALLRHGLRVTATDFHEEAIRRTRTAAEAAGLAGRLTLRQVSFEAFDFPEKYDLVYSGFSLPFCAPADFENVWARLNSALNPGGLIGFQLFGDRDEWAGREEYGNVCFHSRVDVERLISGLQRVYDEEVERDGHTAMGDAKHWHVFHMILRRPQ